MTSALREYNKKIDEFLFDFIKKQPGVCADDLRWVYLCDGQVLPAEMQGKEIQHFVLKATLPSITGQAYERIITQTWLFWTKDLV